MPFTVTSSGSSSGNLGGGCLMLFSLPFIGMGSFFAYQSLRTINNPGTKAGWFGVIFGLVFAGVGGLLFAAGLQSGRVQNRANAVRDAHPTEPWLWRDDWAQG